MKKISSNIFLLFYSVVVIVYSFFVFYEFTVIKKNITQDSFKNAIQEVQQLSQNIEFYYRNRFHGKPIDEDTYQAFSNFLHTFEIDKYKNIFLAKVDNGNFNIIADGEIDKKDRFYFNERFDPSSNYWNQTAFSHKPLYYKQDIQGVWMTYLYPILRGDEVEILAIDFSMENYLEEAKKLDVLKEGFIYFMAWIVLSIFGLVLFLFYEQKRKKELVLIAQEREKYLLKQSKDAQIGQIVDSVAHQWIQPLQTIQTISELLLLKLDKEKNENHSPKTEHIHEIITQTNFALETLAEFRTFLADNKSQELTNIASMIETSLVILDDVVLHHHMHITIEGDTSLMVSMYQNEFKHIVINLIQNAKDAFVKNGIDLRNIVFYLYQKNGSIFLEVSDNAGGIKEGLLDKIFEMNVSTKESASTQSKGMGLYMTKQIIAKMGGDISVKNNDKNGVTFVVQWYNKED